MARERNRREKLSSRKRLVKEGVSSRDKLSFEFRSGALILRLFAKAADWSSRNIGDSGLKAQVFLPTFTTLFPTSRPLKFPPDSLARTFQGEVRWRGGSGEEGAVSIGFEPAGDLELLHPGKS